MDENPREPQILYEDEIGETGNLKSPDLENEPTDEFGIPVTMSKEINRLVRENPDIFRQPTESEGES